MLSEKSIKKKFILQLIAASIALIAIFSIVLYNFIRVSILNDIVEELKQEAQKIVKERKVKVPFSKKNNNDLDMLGTLTPSSYQIQTQILPKKEPTVSVEEYIEKKGDEVRHKINVYYPYDKARKSFLVIKKDITQTYNLFSKILKTIIIVNILGGIIILAYAFFLSEYMLHPVRSITQKLARMNENFLEHIDVSNLPVEFVSLAESINKLIDRIQNFVKYQKELFVGTSHELKTPLAVMKAQNEVTLLKPRDPEKYIKTLRDNNRIIDEMNQMISSILEVGRQEGAQFEMPVEVDVIEFLKEKYKDFNLIANNKKINITMDLEPERYCILTQPTLLMHILQNFVQNAIKFSPEGSNIIIKSRLNGDDFKIQIIDEGPGIDESKDLFAPFKRFGKGSGAGLGLFLARGAADAIGAKLSLKNRTDGKSGTIATIELNAKNFCPADEDDKKVTRRSIFGGFNH